MITETQKIIICLTYGLSIPVLALVIVKISALIFGKNMIGGKGNDDPYGIDERAAWLANLSKPDQDQFHKDHPNADQVAIEEYNRRNK